MTPAPDLLRRPLELYDRAAGYASLALDRLYARPYPYETVSWDEALASLEAAPGLATERVADVLAEPGLRRIENDTRRLLREIRHKDAFRPRWAADSLFARLCYLVCRLTGPSVVVETGVAYGVSSAYILEALEANGRGTLHSIDLPPLAGNYEHLWGVATPRRLRGRWRLHRGASSRLLPPLLEEVGAVDVFVHDSLHTRRNMSREFDAAWPRVGPGGVVLADDVERNGAFGGLRRRGPALWRVVRDRERDPLHGPAAPVVFGLAVR